MVFWQLKERLCELKGCLPSCMWRFSWGHCRMSVCHQELLQAQRTVQGSLQVLHELGEQLKQQVGTSATAAIQLDRLSLTQRLAAMEQGLCRQQAVLKVGLIPASGSSPRLHPAREERSPQREFLGIDWLVSVHTRREYRTTKASASSWTPWRAGSQKLRPF